MPPDYKAAVVRLPPVCDTGQNPRDMHKRRKTRQIAETTGARKRQALSLIR
jgi:hypothetical protein